MSSELPAEDKVVELAVVTKVKTHQSGIVTQYVKLALVREELAKLLDKGTGKVENVTNQVQLISSLKESEEYLN